MKKPGYKKRSVCIMVLLSFNLLSAGIAVAQSSESIVNSMYKKYHNNWYRTLTFTQETGVYRNDSLIRKSTWYEMARFPYELRIDVDAVSGGNKIFYLKDSTYRIRNNKIQQVSVDPNPFIFFLGGMYQLPLDTAKATLKANGYDLSLGTVTNWQGRKTYVIGDDNKTDSTRNQFWVDAEHLYIVRIRITSGKALLDVHLSDHVKLLKGWSETNVKFYRDGKLLQVEKYSNLQPDAVLGDEIFDISRFR